jgi:uncharacterized SAM-binding protein YcdF (DUF218 family)
MSAAIDAIIVPGRGVHLDGTLPPDPSARVRRAVELSQRYDSASVIMSGHWTFMERQIPARTEAVAMQEYALTLGLSPGRIFIEDQSIDTIGNAIFVKRHTLIPHSWRNVVVVASPDHLPRVTAVFSQVMGPSYHLRFEASENVLSPEESQASHNRELRAAMINRELFTGLTPGDDEGLLSILRQVHPGYGPHTKYSIADIASKLAGQS